MLHIASKAARANRSLFAALLIAILAAPGLAAAATPSPHFVIFGDSLSDSGNVFVVNNVGFDEGANNVPPDYRFSPGLNPDAAYARGGPHITSPAPAPMIAPTREPSTSATTIRSSRISKERHRRTRCT